MPRKELKNRLATVFIVGMVGWPAGATPASSVSDSAASTAEYYYSRNDYAQALSLWSEILRQKPDNLLAVIRVAELKLMFEGREASRQTILAFMSRPDGTLSSKERSQLREKSRSLQQLFLTDEGQTLYIQALAKIKEKDCAGALPLLGRAMTSEKGNLKVLLQKARCERSLALPKELQQTLKLAQESDPFDEEIADELAETLIYFGEYEAALSLLKTSAAQSPTLRHRVAHGVALMAAGQPEKAVPQFQRLVEQESRNGVPAVVYYVLGVALSKGTDTSAEAVFFLKRFLSSLSKESVSAGWDPYRCQEKIEQVNKLLASLERPPSP